MNDQFFVCFLAQANPLCLYLSFLESGYISPYHLLLLLTKPDLYFHTLSIFLIQTHWFLHSTQPLCCQIHQIMQSYKHLVHKCRKGAP